jgi:hypothetical protein
MSRSACEPALASLLARDFRGERGPTIAATLYLALYVDPVRPQEARDFIDRARQALGERLRFYQTGSMQDPAPLADTRVRQWLERKLAASKRLDIHTLILNELGDAGVSPALVHVDVNSRRIEPLDGSQLRREEEQQHASLRGATVMTAGALLRVGFPLDHPIAQPDAFVGWLKELAAVKGGCLICGSAGIALHLAMQVYGQEAVDQHDLAKGLLARHPGLDLMPMFGQRVEYMRADGAMHTRIRRAAWLNLVSQSTIEELGGIAAVRAALAAAPAHLQELENGAWLLQAAPVPRIGDVSTGDRVSEYAAVGRLLKPVRGQEIDIDVLSYSLEWRERWHQALDGDELT